MNTLVPMNALRRVTVIASLALFAAASGCADLDVTNPNAPDRDRALATAGDVESLVAGSFHTWWTTNEAHFGPIFFLSAASFQHSGWPANFGTVEYSAFPRGELTNSTADEFYGNIAYVWEQNYSALSAIRDGLGAVEDNPDLAEDLDVQRLRAYGKFVQGLAHASIALFYDQGFVIDESADSEDPELLGYQELMDRAVGDGGYFDQAIDIAQGADFTIPGEWMSRSVDAPTLVQLAHTMKARYMAAVARTPQERDAVDWGAVLAELDAGLDQGFDIELEGFYDHDQFTADPLGYWTFSAWQQLNYFILGMADQSGDYHDRWLTQPIADRIPNPNDTPILIRTPDTRFPQGGTLAEQIASPGEYYAVPDPDNSPCASSSFGLGNSWSQPARGTWRWSYYFDIGLPGCNYENYAPGPWTIVTEAEMRLLEAEARYQMGQEDQAAGLVDQSRTAHGLDEAASDSDLDGNPNDDCVPRLPDGTCGDLMEMLKWEKRLNTDFRGVFGASWYFDGRGWGDLYECTQLEFPVPEGQAILHGLPVETTGGCGGPSASPGSTYDFPGESGGG